MQAISKLTCPSSEEDITSHWKYTDKIYISCVCIVFNHEKYIKDTIDSILAQKSEHKFEVIIHDDCSTDSTKNILLEYKNRFPNIIKLILQEKNQYSQGIQIGPLAIQHALGEYIAICEGDDYWIDPKKISKQINILEKNKHINLSISKAISIFPDGTEKIFCDLGDSISKIPFKECILGPQKDFFPTATFFFRKEIINLLPEWFYTIAPVGDYYTQLYASYNQGCIYIPNITAVYRVGSIGSWTQSLNIDKLIRDRKLRVLCSKLLLKQLKLKEIEIKTLKKRQFIYRKDMMALYIKQRKYISFAINFIITLYNNPLELINAINKSLMKK